MKRGGMAAIAGIALLIAFGVVLFKAVVRRAENYSYYADYSSLNSESSGLKAYYETLVRLGVAVSRNYHPFLKLEGQKGTVIYAGPNLGDFRFRSEKDLEQFERVAQAGARVFILFQTKETRYEKVVAPKPEVKAPNDKKAVKPPEEGKRRVDAMLKRWGVEEVETDEPNVKRNRELEALTPSIIRREVLWHFAKWDARWKPLLSATDEKPILLERGFGQGSIVLLAGAEPFTNQQLLTKPDATLLAVTMTGRQPLIFDEAHLGVAETDTVAGLARQHHLEWVLLGFLALAALYIWRNTVSFIPPPQPVSESGVNGRDAHAALTSLLAQSVSRETLLKELGSEWKRSERYVPNAPPLSEAELERLSTTPVSGGVRAYLALATTRALVTKQVAGAATEAHAEMRTTGETKLVP